MVFTLHRYVFRELFRIFFLAVLALTLILSLGGILQPVQEYGVGPRQAVHIMGYFLPITLTFVLPIAALFAGALVYGRLANDNELDACKASGISLLTLIYPGLALAIMVAIANLILSFHVTPIFVHLAEKSIKSDAKQILFRNIQRRGYYKLPQDQRYLIYAERANSQKGTLSEVVITEVKEDRIQKVTTVDRAKVSFNFDPHKRFNEVRITASNPYHISSEDGVGFSSEYVSFAIEFGSLLGDDINFKKIGEMKKIQADPMCFSPIAKLAHRTYAQFTTELLAQDIEKRLTAENAKNAEKKLKLRNSAFSANSAVKSNFYRLHSGDKFVEFTAKSCKVKGEKEVELSGQVVVFESNVVIESDGVRKQPFRTLRCKKALLRIESQDSPPVFTITMELYSPAWQLVSAQRTVAGETFAGAGQVDGQEGMAIGWLRIPGLIPPKNVDITETFKTSNFLDAIDKASKSSVLQQRPSSHLQGLLNELHGEMRKTLAEIAAEMHSRLVFGIGCVPMILIGIGLGVIKKGGHLLSAFGASCVPAGVLIVAIISGRHITGNLGSQSISGLVLMWSGLAFLALLAVGIYHNLLKN